MVYLHDVIYECPLENSQDRYIRPKPDNRINKNHMTKYFVPHDRKNR